MNERIISVEYWRPDGDNVILCSDMCCFHIESDVDSYPPYCILAANSSINNGGQNHMVPTDRCPGEGKHRLVKADE